MATARSPLAIYVLTARSPLAIYVLTSRTPLALHMLAARSPIARPRILYAILTGLTALNQHIALTTTALTPTNCIYTQCPRGLGPRALRALQSIYHKKAFKVIIGGRGRALTH